jgi:hypothetical protein
MRYRLAACVVLALACAACEDDLETRPPAYPQPEPIGYTVPPSEPPDAPPLANAQGAPQAPPAEAAEAPPPIEPGADGEGAAQAPSAPNGVVIDDGTPAADAPAAPAGPDDAQVAEGAAYDDADPAALSDFRPTLDPYGTWVDDPNYGTVWVPSADVVGDDFAPYVSGGHWAYDDDYVWVSDYSWGWAPFHYGRWVYTGRSWGWIPGRRYAGAWVSWRYGVPGWDYVGWAPIGPTWCWRGGLAVGVRFAPRAPFAFVARNDLFAGPVRRSVVPQGPLLVGVSTHTRPWGGDVPPRGYRVSSGPPPGVLGIPTSSVVHTTPVDRGVMQARAFASPSSAVALGAHAPAPLPGRAWQARGTTTLTGTPSTEPSHFGGRLGAGFRGNAYSAPVRIGPGYGGAAPAYGGPVRGAYPVGGPARMASPGYVYRAPASAPAARSPNFAGRAAFPAGGARYSAPSGGSRSAPSGGFRGGGSYGGSRSGGGRGGGHR